MTDLVDFLLARITEDQRHARAAQDRLPLIYTEAALRDMGIGIAQASHIARHDPARVLAECEAKRRVVATIQRWLDTGYPTLDHVLFALALPYADHPDYREEWRP